MSRGIKGKRAPVKKPVYKKKDKISKPPLSLMVCQEQCFVKMQDDAYLHDIIFNLSDTGTGKSILSMFFALTYGLKMLIFTPGKVVSNAWNDKFKAFSDTPELIGITEYSQLKKRGAKGSPNELLTKNVITDRNGKETIEFIPTTYLKTKIKKGVVIVFDEAQAFKNTSHNYLSMKAVCDELRKQKKKNPELKSKAILLSATLFDDKKSAINYFRIMGIARAPKATMSIDDEYMKRLPYEEKSYGYISEIVSHIDEYCYDVDQDGYKVFNVERSRVANEILEKYRFRKNTYKLPVDKKNKGQPRIENAAANAMTFDLFANVFIPGCASRMESIFTSRLLHRGFFVNMNPFEREDDPAISYGEIVSRMTKEHRENTRMAKKERKTKPSILAIYTQNAQIIENLSLDMTAAYILKRLEENPKCKIVCTLSYVENIKLLSAFFGYGKENTRKEVEAKRKQSGTTVFKMMDDGLGKKGKKLYEKALKYRKQVRVLYGDIDESQRPKIQADFQADNNDVRILFMNIKIGGVGIDLHDTHGGRPRIECIGLDPSIIGIEQAAGRIFRVVDNKVMNSDKYVFSEGYIMFGVGINPETGTKDMTFSNLLQSHYEKSNVLNSLVKSKTIKYPGDYDVYIDSLNGEDLFVDNDHYRDNKSDNRSRINTKNIIRDLARSYITEDNDYIRTIPRKETRMKEIKRIEAGIEPSNMSSDIPSDSYSSTSSDDTSSETSEASSETSEEISETSEESSETSEEISEEPSDTSEEPSEEGSESNSASESYSDNESTEESDEESVEESEEESE